MTPRERLLAVYRGQVPDQVPALADLSYWYAANGGGKFIPGATSGANAEKIPRLLELHQQTGAAIHLNLGSFYCEQHDETTRVESGILGESYHHRYETPVGVVEEVRQWSPTTYSWPIVQHMVRGVQDLRVIRYLFEHVRYTTCWDLFLQVEQMVGDLGLPLVQSPYTGLGFLISRYAGVEQTVLLAVDEPKEFEETVATINAAHERVFTLLAEGPSQVLFQSDNLSSDVQSPPWLERYSGPYYRKMAEIAHGRSHSRRNLLKKGYTVSAQPNGRPMIRELFNLGGKAAVVTGGAGLFGRQIVEALAEAGARTFMASRNLDTLRSQAETFCNAGLNVAALHYDQTDEQSILQLLRQVIDAAGKVDVLVNNAVLRPMSDWSSPITDFAKSMEVNATGLFAITRAFGEHMAVRGQGSIINIGSIQGTVGPDDTLYEGLDWGVPPDYYFHKGGLLQLTRYVASKLGPCGVRVNSISPGGFFNSQDPRFVERYCERTFLKRMANETDLKGAVVFLASDASAYITGTNIAIDGGYTCK